MAKKSTVYHSDEWKKVLIETYGYKSFQYGTPSDSGAFLPAFLVNGFPVGKKVLSSVPFGEGGIISNDEDVKEVFTFLDRIFEKEKLDYIEIKGMDESHIETADKHGFAEVYENFRFIIDLADPIETIHDNFNGTIRYDIKRGSGLGIRVVKENSIEDFYRLYLQTMKRLGTPPQGKDFFANMFKYLGDNIIIFNAIFNGKTISSIILLIDQNKHESRYAFAENDWNYKNLNANSVLLYEAIKYSKHIGCRYFDFGVSRPGGGVWEFKKKWCGDTPIKVYYMYKFRTKGVIDVREGKIKLFAKIWKDYVPPFVARMIGPFIRKQLGK